MQIAAQLETTQLPLLLVGAEASHPVLDEDADACRLTEGQHLAYIVDLDERGMFYAHVEDEAGVTLFEVSNEDPATGWPTENGLWLVDSGYMRHGHDVLGLLSYLEANQVVGAGNSLHLRR
jgi:hypothetical protein